MAFRARPPPLAALLGSGHPTTAICPPKSRRGEKWRSQIAEIVQKHGLDRPEVDTLANEILEKKIANDRGAYTCAVQLARMRRAGVSAATYLVQYDQSPGRLDRRSPHKLEYAPCVTPASAYLVMPAMRALAVREKARLQGFSPRLHPEPARLRLGSGSLGTPARNAGWKSCVWVGALLLCSHSSHQERIEEVSTSSRLSECFCVTRFP